ncbi:hypothetical protein CV014_28815 [Nostoc sp. CMAA1605]|nr:hypothetical protein [Nostoc sp. CMAA1605]
MSARAFVVVVIGVMWSAFFVSGCERVNTPGEVTARMNVRVAAEISEKVLSDGTRCAVIDGERKAAMSCDWGRK